MRVVRILLVLLVLAAVLAFGAHRYWQSRLEAPIAVDEAMLYEVPPGAGYHQVVLELAERGVIEDAWAFRLLTRLEPQAVPRLRVGEYRLEPGMSGRELIALLGSDRVVTYPLTVPEGWTFRQMRELLDAAPKLEHRTTELSDAAIMAELGQEGEHPEGRFFPDTYRYHKGVSDLEILRQAYRRMETILAEVWAERDEALAIDSPEQALILASLIERETGASGERRAIAGVFDRRIKKGMRLQTDPSVIYGMGEDYDGNITRADLREATPYNTYVIDGLPPTPIAMPGRAALEAAVSPLEGDALYFVARGDGSHHFSRTLREHNAAVRRYILDR